MIYQACNYNRHHIFYYQVDLLQVIETVTKKSVRSEEVSKDGKQRHVQFKAKQAASDQLLLDAPKSPSNLKDRTINRLTTLGRNVRNGVTPDGIRGAAAATLRGVSEFLGVSSNPEVMEGWQQAAKGTTAARRRNDRMGRAYGLFCDQCSTTQLNSADSCAFQGSDRIRLQRKPRTTLTRTMMTMRMTQTKRNLIPMHPSRA